MAVEISKEGPDYVALDREVDEVGYGATPEEARADLAATIRELHRELRAAGPDRLGPHMVTVLGILDARAAEGK